MAVATRVRVSVGVVIEVGMRVIVERIVGEGVEFDVSIVESTTGVVDSVEEGASVLGGETVVRERASPQPASSIQTTAATRVR